MATEQLTQTLERYLEAVYRLQRQKGTARVKDIAAMVGVHKSTVTSALRSLSERGLVNYEPYEAVTLTAEGGRRGEMLDKRHRVLCHFLENVLDVEPEVANRNACRMEHAIDERVLKRIVCLLAFLQEAPAETEWVEHFQRFAERMSAEKSCEEWVEECLGAIESPE
jgi:DtxR family Mn-dependent transcriptional regulator